MKTLLILIAALAMCSCASRDDKIAWSTVWHMGKALELGCSEPALIGAQLQKMAERHEKQHKYQINKEGVRYVGSN